MGERTVPLESSGHCASTVAKTDDQRESTRGITTACRAPAIMLTMGSAEIYTMLLAVVLIGGALWVISRFTHRD